MTRPTMIVFPNPTSSAINILSLLSKPLRGLACPSSLQKPQFDAAMGQSFQLQLPMLGRIGVHPKYMLEMQSVSINREF